MKDNFSKQADIYARYRPHYPVELFDFILAHVNNRQTAWDCGTGNGQSAKVLAGYFENVLATDISQKQIEHAEPAGNISYSVQPAERTNFPDNTFDLVVVSQALHWFATGEFYNELKRVSKKNSVFAAWSYSLLSVSTEIDKIIGSYYKSIIGPYWDKERKYVDEEYRTIHFPLKEITAPAFDMRYDWTLADLEGYLNTWSAVQKFIVANNYNPVPDLAAQIKPYWKDSVMKVMFPLHMRIGIIEK